MSFLNTAAQGQQHYGCGEENVLTLKLFKSLTRRDRVERFEKESEFIQPHEMKTNPGLNSLPSIFYCFSPQVSFLM